MPYSLISDTFYTEEVWEALAGGNGGLLDSLQASWVRMNARASHHLSNGYLTEAAALQCCRGRRQVLDLLTRSALGRAPRLHRRGDECPCLGDEWVDDGYAYRIHKFLKRNPSKAEYKRNQAQRNDRRDSRLKGLVLERDGAFCRYCRSGPLSSKATRAIERRKVLQFDHPDPDRPAGPQGENYVVSCAGCNEFKGHRTPFEADMVLLDAPKAAERAEWTARGLVLFDRPTNRQPINDEPPTDQRQFGDPVTDPVVDPAVDPNASTVAEARPETDAERADQPHNQLPKGDGSGRVGQRPVGGPGRKPDPSRQPARTQDAPDIWTRRSRAPEPRAGPP